jgi:hypothetical protein
VRTVKTASAATAVQTVWSSRGGSRSIDHLRSAHGAAELEALKAVAQQRLAEDKGRWISGSILAKSPVRLGNRRFACRSSVGRPVLGLRSARVR